MDLARAVTNRTLGQSRDTDKDVRGMKLACLVLAHRGGPVLARTLPFLRAAGWDVFVHLDRKSDRPEYARELDGAGSRFLDDPYEVFWGASRWCGRSCACFRRRGRRALTTSTCCCRMIPFQYYRRGSWRVILTTAWTRSRWCDRMWGRRFVGATVSSSVMTIRARRSGKVKACFWAGGRK
jgi:hypothetical protein